VDLEQASGRLALAESNLLTEVANLHDVSARFLRVVGRMPTEDFVELIGVLPDGQLPPTSHHAQLEALSSNPAMFAAVENILSAQEQVRAAGRISIRDWISRSGKAETTRSTASSRKTAISGSMTRPRVWC
jgi:outer membrane protein, adhesin transport system